MNNFKEFHLLPVSGEQHIADYKTDLNAAVSRERYKIAEARLDWLERWIFNHPFSSSTDMDIVLAYHDLTGAKATCLWGIHWFCDELNEDLDALKEKGYLICYSSAVICNAPSNSFMQSKERDTVLLMDKRPMPSTRHMTH